MNLANLPTRKIQPKVYSSVKSASAFNFLIAVVNGFAKFKVFEKAKKDFFYISAITRILRILN